MKRLLFLITVLATCCITALGQNIYLKNGQVTNLEGLHKITKGNNFDVNFISDDSDTVSISFDDLDLLSWALDPSNVKELKSDAPVIVFDNSMSEVYVLNVNEKGAIDIYRPDGKTVLSIKGNKANVSKLEAGIYIVKYSNEGDNISLTAKISIL